MPDKVAVTWKDASKQQSRAVLLPTPLPAPAACLLLQNQWETGANGQSHAYQAIRMKSHGHERWKINPITVGIDLEIAVILLIILIHNSAPHCKRWRGACPTFLFVIWQHFHWVALPLCQENHWSLHFPCCVLGPSTTQKERRKSRKKAGETPKKYLGQLQHSKWLAPALSLLFAHRLVSWWDLFQLKGGYLLLLKTGGKI